MKKRSGVQRAVAVLGRDQLDTLSTKQLLGRLARLRFCENSANVSDLLPEEIGVTRGILFKDTSVWRQAYADLKQVLSAREHISRPATPANSRRRRSRQPSKAKATPRSR
jgi:hypothetical protein